MRSCDFCNDIRDRITSSQTSSRCIGKFTNKKGETKFYILIPEWEKCIEDFVDVYLDDVNFCPYCGRDLRKENK
mgnify:CR=1 FL=1